MNSSTDFDVSIIIPCFNEEGHILDSIKEIYTVMNGSHYTFEIIFVDDFSTDKTREKIFHISNEFKNVRYLYHEKNTGKGGALKDGARMANGKFIGHIDIDLEVSADYLSTVLTELENGYDIALVKRKVKLTLNPYNTLRDVAGLVHRFYVKNILDIPFTDVQSGCKIFKRDILLSLLDTTKSQGWFFDVELIANACYRNYSLKQISGYYIRNKKKKSTVKLFSDGIEQIKNLIKFRGEIKRKGIK